MAWKQTMVTKRDGTAVPYSVDKILLAVEKAFSANGQELTVEIQQDLLSEINIYDGISVEEIQEQVQVALMTGGFFKVAVDYIKYREAHKELREDEERLQYMENYSKSSENAASSSETDPNSNVSMKNAANLEGEVFKSKNRRLQRRRMYKRLVSMFDRDIAKQYLIDLENHIIYVHDEASTPVLKPYCGAITTYPLLCDGVGNVDNVTPFEPNDIASFSGQMTNLVFLVSSQLKGAVAVGDYFVSLNYYVIQQFGKNWYDKLDVITTTDHCLQPSTIRRDIRKGMKQFIYGINQPAGNRSYNSPFTNVSYYDKYYFKAMFEEFTYPDGSKPEWKAIDTLQRMFMELHRELRLIKPLTFPVSTIALVHDGQKYLDDDYKNLCAEEWAKGGSFFCYNSDNPSSLASCCRVLNEMADNTFSSTTGMTGIMTGSCNVITLNINRIVQNFIREKYGEDTGAGIQLSPMVYPELAAYLTTILERVYKYHIAYKTLLYEQEERGMYTYSNAGYLYIKKLYSTIGVLGYCEAAQFLGLEVSNNEDYKQFLQLILGTIRDQNKLHSVHDRKRPFLFNSEAVPGENLAVKLYQWDKEDGYFVPEDQNLYNCYFYNPWDNNTSILDKLKLHGREISKFTDGGQAAHLNLDTHLSKEQYLKLLDTARENSSNYFTFNIPMSECADCGHIVNAPVEECPKCHSKHVKYWTRIIGYLTCVDNWSNERQVEQKKRIYHE